MTGFGWFLLGFFVASILALVMNHLTHWALVLSAKARTPYKIRDKFYFIVEESEQVSTMLKARGFEQLQEACEQHKKLDTEAAQ